jgi:hypothetical protein
MVGAVRETRSKRFSDLAAPQAAGADPDAPGRTIDHRADTLKVGIEGSLRLVVGVTDVMTGLMPFGADLTYECHGGTPSLREIQKCSCGLTVP